MTIKGRREGTLGRRGGRGTLASRLRCVVGRAAQPGRRAGPWSARRGQAPGTRTSSEGPTDSAAGGPEPGPVCRRSASGHLQPETSSTALRGGQTHWSDREQPFSLTVQPRQQSRRLIFSPQIGAAFSIWRSIRTNVFKFGQPTRA